MGRTLRALRHRNYQLFFGGQGISLVGTWMQRVALNWLVYQLTGSALLLGAVGFVGQLPVLPLAPVAGVLADRWNMRRMLVLTQAVALVQAAILSGLTYGNVITYWEVLVLSVVLGFVNAFDMPTRQAFVVQMVAEPDDLSNAIALNSFLVNGARLIGPALAGILIATVGEGTCFLLNALSYVAVIVALLAMNPLPRTAPPHRASVWRGMHEGFKYAFGFPPIRALLLLLSVSSVMGMSYATIMPVYVVEVLHAGPEVLGFLLGATGLGAVLGALYLASRSSVLGLGRLVALGAGLFGTGLMATGLSSSLWVALALMFVVGLGMMLQVASTNTVLQTLVDDDKRGRVMSLYTMAFVGMTPFGSLFAGMLAHAFGVPLTLLISGGACALGGLLFAIRLPALRPFVQPIYARKGIIRAEAAPEQPVA